MEPIHIAELLRPFLGSAESALTTIQLSHISIYIDLLRRWNARINLTSVREPDEIITRHFGESLFAARHLFPGTASSGGHAGTDGSRARAEQSRRVLARQSRADLADDRRPTTNDGFADLLDIGSGAGFPGLPIKIWAPDLRVTLIESNQKKVAFLREVIRAITLMDIDVFPGRAQDFPASARTVTLRAVEHFETTLPVAACLAAPSGRLALLIGRIQVESAHRLAASFLCQWADPVPIPQSSNRILLIGTMGRHNHAPEPA